MWHVMLLGINKSHLYLFWCFFEVFNLQITCHVYTWTSDLFMMHQNRDLHSSIYWHVICLYLQEASKQGTCIQVCFDMLICLYLQQASKQGLAFNIYLNAQSKYILKCDLFWCFYVLRYTSNKHQNRDLHSSIYWHVICLCLQEASKQGLAFKYILTCDLLQEASKQGLAFKYILTCICLYLQEASKQGLAFKYILTCDLFIPPRSIKTGTCIQVYIDMWFVYTCKKHQNRDLHSSMMLDIWFVYTSKKHQNRDLHSSIYWLDLIILQRSIKTGTCIQVWCLTCDLFIPPTSIKTGTCIQVYIDMWFVYTSKKHQHRDLHSSIYWHVICLYLHEASKQGTCIQVYIDIWFVYTSKKWSKQGLAFMYILTCDLFIPQTSIKTGTCIQVYIDMWFVYISKKHQNRYLHSSICWHVICLYLKEASKQGLAFKYILTFDLFIPQTSIIRDLHSSIYWHVICLYLKEASRDLQSSIYWHVICLYLKEAWCFFEV